MNATRSIALAGSPSHAHSRRLDLGAAFAVAVLAHAALLWARPTFAPVVKVEPDLPTPVDFTVPVSPPELIIDPLLNGPTHDQPKAGGDNAPTIDPRELVENPGPFVLPVKPEWVRPNHTPPELRPGDYASPSLNPGTGLGEGDRNGVYSPSHLDRVPEPISRPAPRFPAAVRQETDQATVRTQFVVLADGTVGHVVILSSSHPGCDAEVERTLLRWKFKPGWKNNLKVATRMEQVFQFRADTP